MKPLRTAILGCGSFAHTHARILASLPDEAELVAFCSRTAAKAIDYSQQYTSGKAAVFTDHQELIERAELDLLVDCLPPYAHSNEVELAAGRGVHMLIEKPIALSSEHSWRMVQAAEKAGIKTQVGFDIRFGEAIEQLKKLVDSGAAGHTGLMSARYFCNSLHNDWWRRKELSGGQMVEQVIHMVDLMRFFMGEATSVYSRQANLFHQEVVDYTVEDTSVTLIDFHNGSLGVIYASNGAIPNRWIYDFHLVAQNLTAEVRDGNHATFFFTGNPDPPRTIASVRDFYVYEIRDLLNAIRTGSETRCPIREGAKSLDLALAANRSSETRSEVFL